MSHFQPVLEAYHVDGQPPAVRVRRALKALGRSYQLTCLSIVEIKKETTEEVGEPQRSPSQMARTEPKDGANGNQI